MKKLVCFLGIILSLLFFILSCNNSVEIEDKSKEIDEKESFDSFEYARVRLDSFYSELFANKFDKCMSYFSNHLLKHPGEEILKQGMQERINRMGVSESYNISYQAKTVNSNGDTVYTFHTKCFSENGNYHFENIGMINENSKMQIEVYEYSNMPYVSVEKANDKSSDINIFLNEMYSLLNTDDFNEVVTIVDDKLLERLGRDNVELGYINQVAVKENIVEFNVEDISTRIEEDVPVLQMNVKETAIDSTVYKSEITLSVRKNAYKILMIQDIPEMPNYEGEISQEEIVYFTNYVNGFYDALKLSKLDEIVNYVDEDVFLTNSKDVIKQSFEVRNEIYGIPNQQAITELDTRIIYERKAVVLSVEVSSANGKSAEKLTLIEGADGNYLIYGYEYPQEVQ